MRAGRTGARWSGWAPSATRPPRARAGAGTQVTVFRGLFFSPLLLDKVILFLIQNLFLQNYFCPEIMSWRTGLATQQVLNNTFSVRPMTVFVLNINVQGEIHMYILYRRVFVFASCFFFISLIHMYILYTQTCFRICVMFFFSLPVINILPTPVVLYFLRSKECKDIICSIAPLNY